MAAGSRAPIGSPGLPGGLPARDHWNGSDPLESGAQRVKTHLAPRPHQALGLGGRSRQRLQEPWSGAAAPQP